MKPSAEWGPADYLAMWLMFGFAGFLLISLIIKIHEALA